MDNVYSFEVKRVDKGMKLFKDLGLERAKNRRLEVNAELGKIRIVSVKHEEKMTEYDVSYFRSVERLSKLPTCLKLVGSDNKDLVFKFNTKAEKEMLFDLLFSLRDKFPGPAQMGLDGVLDRSDRSFRQSSGHMQYIHGEEAKVQIRQARTPPDLTSPSSLANTVRAENGRPESLLIYCTTFNMGNAPPPLHTTMKEWIKTVDTGYSGKPVSLYDIYAIGVQECSYEVEVSTSREHWQDVLYKLFPKEVYTRLTCVDSWDRSLTIYVRNELECRIQQVETDTVNVGVGGMVGNKGAIGVKFSLYDTTFCFVNSHLAAHQYEVAKRNADFSEIVRLLKLRDSPLTDITTSTFHHVFWMGDLNYRISINKNLCVDLIKDNKWDDLNKMDQLVNEKATGKVFCGFQEGKLVHPPTYKLVRGDAFDEQNRRIYSDERSRVPAWTDRILYKTLQGSSIVLREYGAVNCVTTSDHSPVYALFQSGMTHTSGLRGKGTMLRIKHLEDPFYIIFSEIKARPLRQDEPLGVGEIVLIFDPKILAYDKEVKSTPKKDSANATWSEQELSRLCTIENKPELLAKKYLQISVRSREPGKKQDFTASTIIWLGQEAEGSGEIAFDQPLLRHGVQVGSISGQYLLTQNGNLC